MSTDIERFRELEETAARLAPHVRRGCDSAPSPAVRAAIRAAAAHQASAPRILPFVRLILAAAATLLVAMGGWTLFRTQQASDVRQAALMDDMIFLCTDGQSVADSTAPVSGGEKEELARRLLNLQGLGEAAVPETKAPAEWASPPSTDFQSRNMRALRAQRCG